MNVQGCIQPRIIEDPCTSEDFEGAYYGIYDEHFLLKQEVAFYPTFYEDNYCVNDGYAPAYMITRPSIWKLKSKVECCYRYYQYAFRECMGDSQNDEGGEIELPPCIELPELSGNWYIYDVPDKGIYECVRECAGHSPCNGRAPRKYCDMVCLLLFSSFTTHRMDDCYAQLTKGSLVLSLSVAKSILGGDNSVNLLGSLQQIPQSAAILFGTHMKGV